MRHMSGPPPLFAYRIVNWLRRWVGRLERRLVPAPVALYEQLTGVWRTQMIYALARLGIADRLSEAPRTVEELSALVDVDADSLGRLLRALVAAELLARGADQRYRLTRLSATLAREAPDSMRDIALYGGSLHSMDAWSRFCDVVRTGRDGYELAHGSSLFDYLGEHPDEAATFAGAMVCMTRLEAPALVRGYDWGAYQRLCDVGGGLGWLLGAILQAQPRLAGVLFDDAKVIAEAKPVLEQFGVAARADLVAGSFFEAVPGGCDVYVLKEILHDWDDAGAARILANLRRAMTAGSRLVIIEMLLVDDERPHPAKLLDLQMMTATHRGRQRTRAALDALLSANGLRLARVIDVATPSSLVEAIAV